MPHAQNDPMAPSVAESSAGSFFGTLGDKAGSWLGDKIFGIPKAKTTAQAAQEHLEFNNIAYPGTNAWERLGKSNAMQGVQVAAQQRVNKRDELNNQKELMNLNNRNQLKIVMAQIAGQKDINRHTVGEAAQTRTRVKEPLVPYEQVESRTRSDLNIDKGRESRARQEEITQKIRNLEASEVVEIQSALNLLQDWRIKHAEAGIKEIDLEWHKIVKSAKIVSGGVSIVGGAVAVGMGLNQIRRLIARYGRKAAKKVKDIFSKPPGVPSPVKTPAGWTKVEKYDPTAMDPTR